MKKIITFSIILICIYSFSNAQIINVPAEHSSIQTAIESASDGDTIVVEEGTFFENINFKGKAITVASRFVLDGDTSHISKTIIDGSQALNPDTASTVLMCSGEDTTSVLMGFTITGGKGTNLLFIDWTPKGGGGICIMGSGGKIIHNIIENNRMEMETGPEFYFGAGLLANVHNNHDLVIRNNLIRNNYASAKNADGAGMALIGGRILCENNVITHNTAEATGWVYAGGLYYAYFNTFEGVIDEATIRNNNICYNTAILGESAGGGGGGYVQQQNGVEQDKMKFYNNLLHHNHSSHVGGGIFLVGATSSLFNNTIVDNTGDYDGNNLAVAWEGDLKLYNNIIWSTGDGPVSEFFLWEIEAANFHAFNNLIMESIGTDEEVTAFDNLYSAPIFVPGTFELAAGSPGIGDAIDSLRIDTVWCYAAVNDITGNPRPNPVDPFIDMGAYESAFEKMPYIPDTAFLAALIEVGVDSNEDGLISFVEAEAVTNLDVRAEEENPGNITDMTGIEAFVNLDTLIFYYNKVSSLDLSSNTALLKLGCGVNPLTSLDISACTLLKDLRIALTQLTSIDLSQNTALEWYYGFGNPLTSIDISNNRELTIFACDYNDISSIDVSNNSNLKVLWVSGNNLTSLDVSNLSVLEELNCYNNQLTELDVSENTALKTLKCDLNNLSNLDISNNLALEILSLSGMPSLYEVCVWELPFPLAGIETYTNDSPNLYFTTECGPPVVNIFETDSDSIGVCSTEDGIIYVVPEGTENDLTVIMEVCLDSVACIAKDTSYLSILVLEDGKYWIYARDPAGNISDTVGFTVVTGIGNDMIIDDYIRIYPNPISTYLNIETGQADHYSIEIISMNGQLIYTTNMEQSSMQIDVSPFSKGVYFITVRSENWVRTEKIIKR
ncbi:T9SS type A sorting domain-containing protein [Bacteroidota bacterium]